MNNAVTKRRGTAFVLILATLIVFVSALVPIATAADPAEIDDFSYQAPNDFKVGNSETILRFVFTIRSLSYDEVGFVFSLTNDTPTLGGDDCTKKETTTVYNAITADGKTVDAPDGRWWVAVKLREIPQAAYDTPIYVRAFVTDDIDNAAGTTRYSDVATICVWKANRTDEKYFEKKWTDASSGTDVKKWDMSTVRSGAHFYPDASNDYEGNDLLVEYSMLWNPSQLNFVASNKPQLTVRLANSGGGASNNLLYWSPTDNCTSSDCRYAGGFETGALSTITAAGAAYTPAGMTASGRAYSAYPNIGGSTQADPENLNNGHEWGWHRIGVRLHQELTNEAAVKDGAATATYNFVVTTYLDGNPISQFEGVLGNTDNFLFKATSDGEGGIHYTDIDNGRYLFLYRYNEIQAQSGKTIYSIIGELSARADHDFVQRVRRVATPDAVTYTTTQDGAETFPAKVWFEIY